MNREAGVLIFLIGLLLTGCTTVPELSHPESEARWQARQSALNDLQNWEFSGRIAIQREAEGWFASLHWKQQGSIYQIQVNGPAGQGAARLEGNDSGVTLIRNDKTIYHASRPEELLAAHLGWQVPLSGLHYWIRGLPKPAAWDSLALDAAGHLIQLRQDNWNIYFDRYHSLASAPVIELPKRLVLEYLPLTVRIIIEQWRLN